MVFLAIGCLALGTACGLWWFSPELSAFFTGNSEKTLWLLMFLVGISVGLNKSVFQKVKEYHLRVLIIPLSITAASVAAGFLCAPITGMPLAESVCITSGMGWYSLTGIMLTDLAGAGVGAGGPPPPGVWGLGPGEKVPPPEANKFALPCAPAANAPGRK